MTESTKEFTVLMAHPLVLSNLLTEYETLCALHAEEGGPQVRRRLEDVAYTLCVSTGTRDVETAVVVARHRLPGARVADDSVLAELGTELGTELTAELTADGPTSAAELPRADVPDPVG